MSTTATAAADAMARAQQPTDRWNKNSVTVLSVCFLGWAFDIYDSTIMQLVTPIFIKEWDITPAVMGNVTTLARWIGAIGMFIFPALADVYGRKPILVFSILSYSLFTGITGFATGPLTLLIFASLSRIALSGENPVGMVMVAETVPTKWRATALGGLVGGYPFGFMLCSLLALVIVPVWGWRPLYFLGIVPALIVFWIRRGVDESPRFDRVTTEMLKKGLKKHFDVWSPVRRCPREMLIATCVCSCYMFSWIGWSSWMPQFLASEKHLGFATTARYLSIWMAVAIAAYWICGWLSDRFGRRYVIPAFALPASILLASLGHFDDPSTLFWVGLVTNFLITGSFGTGIGYATELFPTQIRGAGFGSAFFFGTMVGSAAPAILGWIATFYSLGAGLPLVGFTLFLLVPIFLFWANEMTGKELTDYVST